MPFSFIFPFFSVFLSSFLFPPSFVVLRVPFFVLFSFVFVLSSCRFPSDSCIPFFPFTFASLSLVADSVILSFCYFVSALHLPRASCEPEACLFPLRAVFLHALLMLTYLYFFLLFLPFFDFDLDIVCFLFFILSFSCGYYAVSSVSVSAATRLAYSYDVFVS